MSFTAENLAGRPDLIRRAYELGGVVFNGHRRGSECRILCPFHDDHAPSMDVNVDTGVHICRSCGAKGDVVDFLSRRESVSVEDAIATIRQRLSLQNDRAAQQTLSPSPPRTTRYEIRDAQGALVAVHERTDLSDGSKRFRWLRDKKPTLAGLRLADLPLYGSERLASKPGASVIVAEGERCADVLNDQGFLAVATVTGASATPGTQALSILAARDVALWPDFDQPGRQHMDRIAADLSGVAASVRRLSWGERPGDDAADFFERGGSEEQLDHLLGDAQEVGTGEPPPFAHPKTGSRMVLEGAESFTLPAEASKSSKIGLISQPSPSEPPGTPSRRSKNWPLLDPAALYGLAGDIVGTIEPHTEADPVAVLVQFLAMYGNAVGPTPHFQVGADLHRANLFTQIVGDTAKGRKGTSEGQARRIFKLCAPEWAEERIAHGLSSGEGLISAVRDKTSPDDGDEEGDGVPNDPRLLVIESEFAGTLRVMRRDSNTLSSVIRQAWDSGDLRVMTRKDPLTARGAHISMIGHITIIELLRLLGATDASNGFANRFLWVLAKRSKELPEGGNLTDSDLRPLSARVEAALDAARRIVEVKRSPAALELWKGVYSELSRGRSGLYGSVTSRAEAQVIRVSLVYALLDRSPLIEESHLKAALALWRYSDASARYIFGDMLGDPVADRILKELRARFDAGLTRTEISALFGRNLRGGEIEQALMTLQAAGLAYQDGTRESTSGRPVERWFASANG